MNDQHIDLTTETPIPINQAPKYYPAGSRQREAEISKAERESTEAGL
jgi:hypothetical protein